MKKRWYSCYELVKGAWSSSMFRKLTKGRFHLCACRDEPGLAPSIRLEAISNRIEEFGATDYQSLLRRPCDRMRSISWNPRRVAARLRRWHADRSAPTCSQSCCSGGRPRVIEVVSIAVTGRASPACEPPGPRGDTASRHRQSCKHGCTSRWDLEDALLLGGTPCDNDLANN